MKKKTIIAIFLITALGLLLVLTTYVLQLIVDKGIEASQDDKLGTYMLPFFTLAGFLPIYIAEIDLCYVTSYFFIRKKHKYKALAIMNILIMAISLIMIVAGLGLWVFIDYLNWELFFTPRMLKRIISITFLCYMVLRGGYCIINAYAVKDMLKDES